MSDVVLAARGVSKRFGGTQAVDNVTLELRRGLIHGLIGPNGAGKSTAVGLLVGRLQPDAGTVELAGEPVRLRSARAGLRLGIVPVPQELAVPEPLTVAQFINLGTEPTRLGMVRRRAERRAAREVLERLELSIDIGAAVGELGPSEQKAVVVARALHHRARVLLLDEPSAGMSAEHAEPLLRLLERLRKQEVALLYISHRLKEVERICDVVSVMRDGAKVAELSAAEATHDALREQLERGNEDVRAADEGGRGADGAAAGAKKAALGPVACVVDGLTGRRLSDASFSVPSGEVLGIAGLPGSGVEDVFAALAGFGSGSAGRVTVGGRTIASPTDAVAAGVGYLPPSRAAAVLVDDDVARNMTFSAPGAVTRAGIVTKRRERRAARPFAEQVGVGHLFSRRMGELSGGNQQRALFGRLLLMRSQVLVLEGPTVGVDINARRGLHMLIRELAAEGRACIVGSEEPEELVSLCDRVIVLSGGRIATILTGAGVTEREVLRAMTGGATMSASA